MPRVLIIITRAEAGQRLDHFLVAALPERAGRSFTRAEVKSLIDAGAVQVDGRRAWKASLPLRERARLQLELPAGEGVVERTELSPSAVVFEDEVLIVIDKPAGLPSHATPDPDRDHAQAALTRFLASRDGREPYLALHHRLDAGTSGLLLFAKDARVNATLTDRFRGREVQKCYRALVAAGRRPAAPSWRVENVLGRVSRDGGKVGSVRSGGQAALTDFLVVAEQRTEAGWVMDLEARPHTGRMHQIRVHLAEDGLPIVGDTMYGGAAGVGSWRPGRMMLHAWRLALRHPLSGENLELETRLPSGWWPWGGAR